MPKRPAYRARSRAKAARDLYWLRIALTELLSRFTNTGDQHTATATAAELEHWRQALGGELPLPACNATITLSNGDVVQCDMDAIPSPHTGHRGFGEAVFVTWTDSDAGATPHQADKAHPRAAPGVVRYRKRPVEVDTIQWTGNNEADVQAFTGAPNFHALSPEDREDSDDPEATATVYDKLHSTWMLVYTGQHIVRGVKGEHYPIAEDVLAETYELPDELDPS
jgi:hypothetical protein